MTKICIECEEEIDGLATYNDRGGRMRTGPFCDVDCLLEYTGIEL